MCSSALPAACLEYSTQRSASSLRFPWSGTQHTLYLLATLVAHALQLATLAASDANVLIDFTLGQPFAKVIPATWWPETKDLLDFSQTYWVSIKICAVRSPFFQFWRLGHFCFLDNMQWHPRVSFTMLLSHYSIGLVALYHQPQPGVITASTRLPQIFTALHPIGEPLAAVHILALLFKFLVANAQC